MLFVFILCFDALLVLLFVYVLNKILDQGSCLFSFGRLKLLWAFVRNFRFLDIVDFRFHTHTAGLTKAVPLRSLMLKRVSLYHRQWSGVPCMCWWKDRVQIRRWRLRRLFLFFANHSQGLSLNLNLLLKALNWCLGCQTWLTGWRRNALENSFSVVLLNASPFRNWPLFFFFFFLLPGTDYRIVFFR